MLLLFVVGPERLPAIAGYLGKWFGKLQRYFFRTKKDSIQQEAEEPTKQINKILDDQKSSLDFLQKEINDKKRMMKNNGS